MGDQSGPHTWISATNKYTTVTGCDKPTRRSHDPSENLLPGGMYLIINTAKPRLPPRFPPRVMRRKRAQGRVCCDPAASGLHQDGRGGKRPWEGLETPGQYQTAQGSGFKYKVPHPTDGRSAGNRWVTGRGQISGAVDARDLLLLPAGPPLQPPGGWCARARRHGVLTLKRF